MKSKLTSKFNYVFVFTVVRTFLFSLEKLVIQRYISNQFNLVDYFLEITPVNLLTTFKLLKSSLLLSYELLTNLTCIDNLNLKTYKPQKRFTLVYVFSKINSASRITILINFKETMLIPSIASLYKDATWLEREVFDLFGIFFINHKDLRRILTDYGFKGHPLRKDFPLTGFNEVRYSEKEKKVMNSSK